MPMLRFSSKLLTDKKYADLSALERLTMIELSMFSPMRIDEAEELLGNREATYQSLYTKGYLAKNDTHFVVVSDLFKMDDVNARVALHREIKKEEQIKVQRKKIDDPTDYYQMQELYNSIVVPVKGCTMADTTRKMSDIRKQDLKKGWNKFISVNKENNRDTDPINILKTITTYLNFVSNDVKELKSDNWVADIEFVYRPRKIDEYVAKMRAVALKRKQQMGE